jgi:lipoyl(octanoyl) transferase
MKPRVELLDWGAIDYAHALDWQREMFERLVAEKGKDERGVGWIVLCEHPHVYTLGRSGKAENLLVSEEFLSSRGASLHHTERGGDITYHGPGQTVVYPILDLEKVELSLRDYITALEQAVIETVAEFGIEAGRVAGKTGVWIKDERRKTRDEPSTACGASVTDRAPNLSRRLVEASREGGKDERRELENGFRQSGDYATLGEKNGAGSLLGVNDRAFFETAEAESPLSRKPERKICAIGVRASRGVVMHGLALNVATDLGWFEHINPCGMVGGAVTSMEKEIGHKLDREEVKRVLCGKLCANLKVEL